MLAAFAADSDRCARWKLNLWDRVAYAARYGKTSPDVSMAMEVTDLRDFNKAVSRIVEDENKPRK